MATFLIADDSGGKRMFLKSILKHAKWDGEVLEAATTEEAGEVIRNEKKIDAAFIDYEMPSQNGPA
ncbi:response regulator, partial [Candidatus Peregrinibacteria bacterium]|nr:response regulator [Candidatus Peregrinibacteria bacterium]